MTTMFSTQLAIDISHHQGSDSDDKPETSVHRWDEVHATGVSLIIVKASEGRSFVSSEFVESVKGAVAAGHNVAAYHVVRPDTATAPEESARALLSGADLRAMGGGFLAMDYETKHIDAGIARGAGAEPWTDDTYDALSSDDKAAGALWMCEHMHQVHTTLRAGLGYWPAVYISERGIRHLMAAGEEAVRGALHKSAVWLAGYVSDSLAKRIAAEAAEGRCAHKPELSHEWLGRKVALWQFTSSLRADDYGIGKPGGSGDLDGNVILDPERLARLFSA